MRRGLKTRRLLIIACLGAVPACASVATDSRGAATAPRGAGALPKSSVRPQSGSTSVVETALSPAVEDYLASESPLFAMPSSRRWRLPAAAVADAEGSEAPGNGQDAGELARKTQNPISDLISLPFQNNTGFDFGVDGDVQNILNIQPVVPLSLNDDWNLITRTILPVVYQPSPAPGVSDDFGLGDVLFTAFLSPARPSKLIWGAGPAVLLPTSTNDTLGAGEWGLGPSGVVLAIEGPWVYGALVNNVWSFEGNVNSFLLQPFANYNLPQGWYLTSSPIITANWEADGGERWTVPIGAGVGKITKIGRRPINVQLQVFYNVEHPSVGPEWSVRFQIQLLFPKG